MVLPTKAPAAAPTAKSVGLDIGLKKADRAKTMTESPAPAACTVSSVGANRLETQVGLRSFKFSGRCMVT